MMLSSNWNNINMLAYTYAMTYRRYFSLADAGITKSRIAEILLLLLPLTSFLTVLEECRTAEHEEERPLYES
jgi:hypothetical protein